MPAYAKSYVMDAMENLGEMADSAVSVLKIPLERFWPLFAVSEVAQDVSSGVPFAIAGHSGLELAVQVCDQAGIAVPTKVRRGALDSLRANAAACSLDSLSCAYWCGWSLGYYQWLSARSFLEIERRLPITSVIGMYRTFHEESEERFCEAAEEIMAAAEEPCGLKRQRLLLGLSQSQLARRSGVGLRAIQQYEQGAKDILKASFDRIESLAQALHCEPKLLMDTAPPRYDYAVIELP